MAYDEGLASIFRDALIDMPEITEKRMFGGLCFLWRGHMLCGVHKDGAMVRVGKPNYDAALSLAGVSPLAFTSKTMTGFVDLSDDALADDTCRNAVMGMALEFVASLPAK